MAYVKGHYRQTRSGNTWVKGHTRNSNSIGGISFIGFILIYIIYFIIQSVSSFISENYKTILLILIIVSSLVLAFSTLFLCIKLYRKYLIKQLLNDLNNFLNSYNIDSNQQLHAISSNITKLKRKPDLFIDYLNESYQKLVSIIIDDGIITDTERELLIKTENTFNLDKQTTQSLKKAGFLSIYNLAIKNKELSENDEIKLLDLLNKLGIDDANIENEKNFIKQLSDSRILLSSSLIEVQCDIKLKDNEKCFYISNAYQIKRRIQKGDFFFEPFCEGKLYFTNQRILFIGTSSLDIKLSDIALFDILDEDYITISKFNRANPFFFSADNPFYIKALFQKLIS